MGQPRRGGRWIGLAVGLCLTLGSASLLAQATPGGDGGVIANKNSKVFHRPTCATLKRTAAKNKLKIESAAEAVGQGFQPCKVCHPDEGAPQAGKGAKGKAPKGRGKGKGKADDSDDGGLKFSRDIAPILVNNCSDCHGGAQPKAQFNLTTFNKLMAGGKNGQVIVAGKPDESKLVQLLEAGEMPRGNNRKLSDGAVEKVAAWVKAGALLDAGKDPEAELRTYAATAADLRLADLAKLPPEERDKRVKDVALERWKKASDKTSPEMSPGRRLLLFSNLPKRRAEALVKAMESQLTTIQNLLGPSAPAALNGPEKIGLYVFNEPKAYVEFVRAIENREVEGGVESNGRLDVEGPYIAAVDPLGGRDEPGPSASKRKKSKGADDDLSPTAERSLAGVLTEAMAEAAVASAGKPPRWMTLGLGAYLAARVEPRSPYYRALRAATFEQGKLGWAVKANEALGGEGEPGTIKALGFSLFEWIGGTSPPALAPFVRGMLQGQEKLDEGIRALWNSDRDQFLGAWGAWVAQHYGRAR